MGIKKLKRVKPIFLDLEILTNLNCEYYRKSKYNIYCNIISIVVMNKKYILYQLGKLKFYKSKILIAIDIGPRHI